MLKNLMTNDAGKLMSIINNSNYKGEAKTLYYTYYGYYTNIFTAVASLILKK